MDAPCARESDKEWILLRYARWMKSSETANDANVTNNWEWKVFLSIILRYCRFIIYE